jgi:N-acetylglucosaminyl-diphospho-decaprenol L-rhamnosyltransferase
MMPGPSGATSRVDVVIVTAGGVERTVTCLAHLGDPLIASRTVVENSGSSETIASVARQHPDVEVVSPPGDRGLSAAFNRGAERGSAPLILFLNDDVFAAEHAVGRLVDGVDADPSAVAAGGRLVGPDGETQTEYLPSPFPTLRSFVRLFWGLPADARRPTDELRPQRIEHAAGACLLVRRSAFAAIGGWDERFWYWFEDVDISRRLAAHGHILFIPTAVFAHVGGATASALHESERHARFAHGALQYAQSHFSRPTQIALGAAVLAGVLPRLFKAPRGSAEADAERRVIRNSLATVRGRPLPLPKG